MTGPEADVSTEQAELPKGTRVEITDPEHDFFGEQFEVMNAGLGGHFVEVTWSGTRFLTNEQIRVIEQPEPTIGQLVDAMHGEIERVCGTMTLAVKDVQMQWRHMEGSYRVWVAISGFCEHQPVQYTTGSTPQAALRAMIERLREVK